MDWIEILITAIPNFLDSWVDIVVTATPQFGVVAVPIGCVMGFLLLFAMEADS